jgi:hypothetical protein
VSQQFIKDNAAAWAAVRKDYEEAAKLPWLAWPENGPGALTADRLHDWLPPLLTKYNIKSILDVGCGDWSWMSHVHLGDDIGYIGWDVEPKRVAENNAAFWLSNVRFECVNIMVAPAVPPVDLILCRHTLIHLTTGYISEVLAKFKASGSKYLLATHFPDASNEFVYDPEEWPYTGYCERAVNLQGEPFNLKRKLTAFEETPAERGVIAQPHELALFRLSRSYSSSSGRSSSQSEQPQIVQC